MDAETSFKEAPYPKTTVRKAFRCQ